MNIKINEKLKGVLVIAVLVGAALAVYANSLGGEFLWDNRFEITDNVFVKNFELGRLFNTSMTSGAGRESSFYRPLVSLSFALDYQVWGLKPFGFHLTNILLHALSSVTVLLIFSSIQKRKLLALIVGLLFAVHPTQVETVSYIAGRSDLLLALFSLFSIYFFIKYRINSRGAIKTTALRFYYIFSLISFVLALLAKEIAVIVPILLLAVYFAFLKNSDEKIKGVILKILPFLFFAFLYAVLRLSVLKFGEGFSTFNNTDFFTRLSVFLKVLPIYWKTLLIPTGLRFRMEDITTFNDRGVLLLSSLIILGGIVYLSLRSKWRKGLLFGFGWFFIAIAPVSSLIIPVNYILGERWLRLPAIGIFFLIASGITAILDKSRSSRKRMVSVLILFSIYLMFLSVTTIRTNRIWKNSISFYSHLVDYYPFDIDNRFNLAVSYKEMGLREEAEKEYKILIQHLEFYLGNKNIAKTNQQILKAYKTLASLYAEIGKYDEAIVLLEKLIDTIPDPYKPYALLGQAYALKGDHKKAMELFEKALSFDPANEKTKKLLEEIKK